MLITQPKLSDHNAPFVDVTFRRFAAEHCVYEVWHNTALIYIGVCNFVSIGKLPDAKQNAAFMDAVQADTPISVVIKHLGTRMACFNRRGEMIRQLKPIPICNKWAMGNRNLIIMCNEDGTTYRTATECAAAYGISAGNLSAHLCGKPGVNTLAGRTFRKVLPDDSV